MTVNCSASCAELGLEIELSKKEVAQGVNWKTFELSDVREDISPICYANCPNQTESSVSITVYGEWPSSGTGLGRLGWRGRAGLASPSGQVGTPSESLSAICSPSLNVLGCL